MYLWNPSAEWILEIYWFDLCAQHNRYIYLFIYIGINNLILMRLKSLENKNPLIIQ